MMSIRSALDSSTPATSSNVTRFSLFWYSRARLLPKPKMPCCAWPARRLSSTNRPMSRIHGRSCSSTTTQTDGPCSALTLISTFSAFSAGSSEGSPKSGTRVLKRSDVWSCAVAPAELDGEADAGAEAGAPGEVALLALGL